MSITAAIPIGGDLGKSDPLKMESPTVDPTFDPGKDDRTPKIDGEDKSMPDTRLGLRNEARAKLFIANRDRSLIDDPHIL